MDSPSRRAVLATGGALVLAACSPTRTASPPPPDPDLLLRRRAAREVGSLVAAYAAVLAAFPAARAELATLAAEHESHVRALAGPAAPPPTSPPSPGSPSPGSPSTTVSPTPGAGPVTVPATLPTARAWLARLEQAAAARRTDEALRAGADLARLLAAVAACESSHAALLLRAPGHRS